MRADGKLNSQAAGDVDSRLIVHLPAFGVVGIENKFRCLGGGCSYGDFIWRPIDYL